MDELFMFSTSDEMVVTFLSIGTQFFEYLISFKLVVRRSELSSEYFKKEGTGEEENSFRPLIIFFMKPN